MGKYLWGMFPVLAIICFIGCGSETPTAQQTEPASPSPATSTSQSTASTAENDPSIAVVSEFLDRVRRGGSAQMEAVRLLTETAQAECQRTGLTMGSMGSPDARFEITRSQPVPDKPDARLVHSLWIEPGEAEADEQIYQVVWAVKKESSDWRISGLAMELQPGEEPLVVDFESGDEAAATLGMAGGDQPADGSPAATQATAPPADPADPTLDR